MNLEKSNNQNTSNIEMEQFIPEKSKTKRVRSKHNSNSLFNFLENHYLQDDKSDETN